MITNSCGIFILTDTPELYGDDVFKGADPYFVSTISEMLDLLKEMCIAGLVLEVDKVMRGSRDERNALFNYAGNYPILRTRVNPRHGYAVYLDDRESFFANLYAATGSKARSHERIPAEFDCFFSNQDDPIMADARPGRIMDISQGGCHILSDGPFVRDRFVHIRVPDLLGARPVFASVRWIRKCEGEDGPTSIGLMFVDPTDEQLDAIAALKV